MSAAGALLLTSTTQSIANNRTYRAMGADGIVIFSDAPVVNGEVQRSGYRNSFGRLMATRSCEGLTFKDIDRRGETYRQEIEQFSADASLDPALVMAVVRVESCFDPKARSVAGAEGLMQLMPATARSMGVTNAFLATHNLSGGTRYLARMLVRYKQDTQLALAAYNAGPGNVDRHGGVPPFPETLSYIKRVLSHRDRYSKAQAARSNRVPQPLSNSSHTAAQ